MSKKTEQILTLILFSACAGSGFGQATNSGDIRGTVTDPSGAVVPGVTITVKDIDKDVSRTVVTDAAGLYNTGPIVPDHYLLTFTKQGFSTLQQGPITLNVGQVGINAVLAVGQVTQEVVVNTNAPLLDTTNPEQSTTLQAEQMEQLPQVGTAANWQQFIILLPGTSGAPTGSNNNVNPGVSGVSANGSEPFSTALLDGATVSSPQSNNIAVPMIFDAIQEVKIVDSLFSAQYGVGGIIYNQISKGGSEHFHGEAYEYFQNTALDAAPYSFGRTGKVPILHYNEFGGNIGGPILKKRMFFFFNYDKIIDNGGAANGFITVPDAAMLGGDFTGMNTIYDPTTQTIDANGVVHRTSFASEYGNGNKIPANLIDPVAKAIQSYFPAPNTAATTVNGIPTNNYFYNVPSSDPFQRYFGRLDYDVASSNRLTVSEAWDDNPGITLNQGICPVNCNTSFLENSNAQISDVWTVNSSMVNEARFGFTDELDFYVPYSSGQGIPAKLGWQFAKADLFPTINISGEYSLGPGTSAIYKEFIFDPSDVFTLVRGRHVLQFGGEFLAQRADSTSWGNLNAGTMSYSGNYTAATQGASNTTGSSYADFLLGETSSWSAGVSPEYGGRMKIAQAFVQDDIKLKPNLTINLGLRWMGETGWSDVKGNERAFDPSLLNPAVNKPGAMWYAVTHTNGRTTLQNPVWDVLMPRVGFSYQPHPETTIRGGFGEYTYPWSVDNAGGGLGSAFSNNGGESDSTNGVAPVVILASSGNVNYQGAAGASINSRYVASPLAPDSYNGQGVGYTQYNAPVPKLYQWNLSLQHAITSNLMVELAYVASHGANQGFATDLNQVPVGSLGPNDASGATNARPYPWYQGIGGYKAIGISNYNSLQATIEKRMSGGLDFNFNYTWSKFLDEQDTSGQGGFYGTQVYQNAYVPGANYGPSNFDKRDMFKGRVVYQLPFGHERRFFNNSRILDETIGGWLATATIVAQSGSPFTLVMANNTSYSQAGSQYPNLVGNPQLTNRSVSAWFNAAAFAAPAPGTFGDFGRNTLYGPGLSNVDFALGKQFDITSGVNLEFSADATNVLNHPSFAQPDATIGPGHQGQITGVTVGGRAMQLVGRLRF